MVSVWYGVCMVGMVSYDMVRYGFCMVTVWSRPSCSDSEFLARRLELDPELELRFSFEPSMSPRPETASCDDTDIGDNNQFHEEGNRDCLNDKCAPHPF